MTSCSWRRYSGVAIFVMSGLAAFACSQPEPTSSPASSGGAAASGGASSAPKVEADKPFAPGGRITLTLAAGGYDVRASSDGHIRVTLDRDIGDTKVDVTITDDHAEVVVKDTPQRNFHAIIEVPKTSDIVTRLTAGELMMAEEARKYRQAAQRRAAASASPEAITIARFMLPPWTGAGH